MATILQQQKKLEKLSPKVTIENVFKALKSVQDKLIELNKSQLNKGEDIFGDVVGYYTSNTERKSKLENTKKEKKEGSPYNFQWSGDFFDGFKVGINDNEVTILSNVQGDDDKLGFLKMNNLEGLQKENLNKVIKEDVLPFMHKIARETLGI